MPFDVDGARKAGYSDQEIADHLARSTRFDAAAARASGYSDDDIIEHLNAKVAAKAAPKTKSDTFLERWGGNMAGAFEKVKADAAEPPQRNTGNALKDMGAGFARTGRQVADLAGLIASPVTGAVDAAVIEPGARLLDKLPADAYAAPALSIDRSGPHLSVPRKLNPTERHEADRSIVNNAVSAARPGALSAPAAAVAPRVNALTEKVAAFDRARVTPSVAAAGGGKGASALTNVVAENPIAGAPARARLRTNLAEVKGASDRIAAGYGADRGAQIAGENVQAGVRRFAKDRSVSPTSATAPAQATSFAAKAGKLYDDAFAAIPDGPAPATETLRTAQDALGRVSAPNVAALIKSPKVAEIADALQKDASQVTFGDLRALRTWVREAKKNPELRGNIGDAQLAGLENALTQDIMGNAAALGGPEAASKLRRADQFYAAGSDRINGALKAFDKAGSGEGAYTRIIQAAGSGGSADAQKLLSLKRSLAPDEWGDVAATTVRRLGAPTKGAVEGAPTGDEFSISTFVSNYAAMSPRGRDILFGATGGGGKNAAQLKADLDNLANVAGALKGVEKGANASKTSVAGQALATVGGLSTPGARIPTLGVLASMAVTGEVMTNPVAVRWLASLSRASQLGSGALKTQMGRLNVAAQKNRALLPVYEAAQQALLAAPAPARLAAPAAVSEEQPGPPP